jgi:ABC-type amino acid transport substrate-binding protein
MRRMWRQSDIAYVVVNAQNRFAALHDGSADIICDSSSITMGRRESGR